MRFLLIITVNFLFFIQLHSQNNVALNIKLLDSFVFSDVNEEIYNYTLVNSKMPLIVRQNGIYSPKDRNWFFKFKNKDVKFENIVFSTFDTSIYMVIKNNNVGNIVRRYFHENIKEMEYSAPLPPAKYSVFPVGYKKYYLTRRDSILKVYISENNTLKLIKDFGNNAYNIYPIDSSLFIVNRGKKIYLNNLFGKEELLFESPILIYNVCFADAGVFVISTPKGVFAINNKKETILINSSVNDGILRKYSNFIFVLSSSKKKIYKYSII
jgi:hypothetical protein